MCTINNMMQKEIYSNWVDFKRDATRLILEKYADRKPAVQQGMVRNFFGAGASGGILPIWLNRNGYRYSRVVRSFANIVNGCIIVRCLKDGAQYGHAIAIRHGYIIDSIGPHGLYRNTGALQYYDRFEFSEERIVTGKQ